MRKQIYSLFAVSIAFSISACSFKKSDRGLNEEAQPTNLTISTDDKAAPRSAGTEVVASVQNLDLKSIFDKTSAIATEADAIGVIDALEKSTVNASVWNDPKLRVADNVVTSLSYYNWAVIRLIEIAPDSQQTAAVIERYQKMAMAGCSDELTNCQNILWLRKDPRSSKVIEMIVTLLDKKMDAQCKTDCASSLKQYYDLLAASFDMQNHFANPTLEFLYLKRASQFAAVSKSGPEQNSDFLKRHGRIFENLMAQHPADAKDEKFAAFVKAFQPWTFSHLTANNFPYGAEKMFSFAALHYVYGEGKKTLNPDLRAAINSSQESDDKTGPSFKKSLQTLLSDARSKEVFKGLNFDTSSIQGDDFYNEYFFMIDRLYRGHLNLEEAGSLWQGSQQDQKKLMKTLDSYIKIELVKRIVKTNQYLGDIFLQKGIKNDDLFKQAIQKSEPLTKEWDVMGSQMDRIAIFLGQQRGSGENALNLKEAQSLIESVKRNAKFISVYPNMMLLGYFMIGADAKFKFTSWSGREFEVDPTTIMDYMLDGGLGDPWFLFGGDTAPLNKTELIYAFHYALNAGAFETFASIKDSKGLQIIDRVSFFQKALKKTILNDFGRLKDALAKLQTPTNTISDYSALMDVCENESKNNKNYQTLMKLDELQYFSIFGTKGKGLIGSALSLFDPMNEFAAVRDTYELRLTQLKAMMEPLQANMDRLNLPSAEIKKMKAQLQTDLDELENIKRDFLKEAVTQYRSLSACTGRLIWIERERESQIFTAETNYLGQVYDAMTTLKGLSGEDRKKKAAELTKSLEMGEGESIETESYVFSRWNLLSRFARFSSALKPTVNFVEPDSTTKDSLKSQVRQITFISKSSGEVLSREAFINNGMTQLNSQSGSMVAWLQDIATLNTWNTELSTAVSLYKMGFDTDLYKDPKTSLSAGEIIDLALETASFVNIQETEKIWLKKMSQNELIPRDKIRGFLFDTTETEFRGILDTAYMQVTDVTGDLKEAARHAMAFTNKGRLLFPMPEKIETAINAKYKRFVTRSEEIIKNFDDAIEAKQKKLDLKNLQITYRLDGQGTSVYTPNLIDNGSSVLVDVRKQNNNKAILSDFHNRRTNQFYKESMNQK